MEVFTVEGERVEMRPIMVATASWRIYMNASRLVLLLLDKDIAAAAEEEESAVNEWATSPIMQLRVKRGDRDREEIRRPFVALLQRR